MGWKKRGEDVGQGFVPGSWMLEFGMMAIGDDE